MRPLLSAALALACLAAGLSLPSPIRATAPVKVAIIVGPVGALTPTYLHLAETAAATAERHGASVARAYSPSATPANVLAAVAGAHIVIYFGHGYGHPSPYGALDTTRQNGWGLQGPRARGTHDDALNGELAYYGEDWIVANARPAPGFVMIYSNTCYAPGASEGGFAPATPAMAAERVARYSRKVFAMGGSAYYATDFDRGAADLLDGILAGRRATYGTIFASDPRYVPTALTTQGHWFSAGQEIWLHRTKYTDGPPNYWYAFAGNPAATPARSWDPVAPTAMLDVPAADALDVPPSTSIRLRINEPVTGIDGDSVTLLTADGQRVEASVSHDAPSGVVALRPEQPLDLSARYTVALGDGIADAAGNPLAPVAWSFTTRLDADAWPAARPVVLRPGTHRLVQLGPDGTPSDEQLLEVLVDRWMVAGSRARLPGEAGTWLELESDILDGWWVAETPRSHATGLTEETSLPDTEVVLAAPLEYHVVSVVDGAVSDPDEVAVRHDRSITVDRRAVIDGRTYLRIVDGLLGHAGRWVLVATDAATAHPQEQRVLARQDRPGAAVVVLVLGNQAVFHFDDAGRVIERGTIAGGPSASPLVTEETIEVNGSRFFVLTGGTLDGWAVSATSVSRVLIPEPRDPS